MKQTRLELDFVAPPQRPVWLGLLLLCVALIIAADLALRFRDARIGLAQPAVIQATQPATPPPLTVPVQRLEAEARAAENVMRQLALPWAMMIQALEEATTGDIALLQVEPQAQQQLLRITAQARNPQAILFYQSKLAAAPNLENVHLVDHQVLGGDLQTPLQFTLQASFKVAP